MHTRTSKLSLFLALTLAACTAPPEPIGTDEGAEKFDPTDDEETARLIVELPDPLTAPWSGAAYLNRSSVSLDVSTTVKPGKHCIGVGLGYPYNGIVMEDCNATAASGKSTTYVLPEIELQIDAARLSTDFGPNLALQLFSPDGVNALPLASVSQKFVGVRGAFSSRLYAKGTDINSTDFDVDTSKHTVSKEHDVWTPITSDPRGELELTVEANELSTTYGGPMIAHLSTWKSSSYTDDAVAYDANGRASGVRGAFATTDDYAYGRELRVDLVDPNTRKLLAHGVPPKDASAVYVLASGGFVHRVDVAKGKTTKASLGRLEVSDVEVTDKTTGEKRTVAGTFIIERKFSSSWVGPALNGSEIYATGSGTWVPEGEYRVTVSYDAGDGPKKKYYYATVN